MRIAMLLHKSVEFDSRVRREASALAPAGHDVAVLELAAADGIAGLEGFTRISCLPPGWIRRHLPSLLYRAVMLVYFARAIVRARPDAVHAHDAAMLLPGLIGSRLTGAMLVYDSHELAASVPYRERTWAWFVTAIERVIVPRCDAVITVSDGIATRLRERYGLDVTPTVVRNVSALEPGGKGGLRRALGLDQSVPLVLHQGAPAPDRGCEVLVEAVARLDGVYLAFLGDPEPGYGERLLALIEERGIGDRVSLLPSVPLGELLGWTAEADVGVTLLQDTCENHRLALPNKLFEYIAAGVPVVASALPEVQGLVDRYGVGWCAAPSNPEAVARALEHALSGHGAAERRDRLARAAEELSWANEQRRLVALYESLEDGRTESSAPRLVLQLVRNAVSTDGRVLRAAHAVEGSAGARALVVGVAPNGTLAAEAVVEGIRVIRVGLPAWFRAFRRARPKPTGEVDVAVPLSAPSGGGSRRITPRARLRRYAAGLAFAIQAVKVARREQPAVVHANDWNTMWAAVAIKLLCGSRVVYDSHELWADRNGRWELRPWLVAAEALFVRIADAVITTSPGHARALADRYRIDEPLVVRNIPDWVVTSVREPQPPPAVVYIGGLMPGRGLEQMIDALPQLPHVLMRAVGPGADGYREELLERAAAVGVTDRLELRPPVAPSDVSAVLGGAAIGLCLIQPICRSYELSLPNKLLEYAAAGIPILASDLPVISEVVNNNRLGEVVHHSDRGSIAAGTQRLLEPDRRAAAVLGARAFSANNTWAREREQLTRLYQELAGGTAGGSDVANAARL